MPRNAISFEVHCENCGFFELWGLERAVKSLVSVGKLSAQSDFDAELFAQLFLQHIDHVFCPECHEESVLSARPGQPGNWDWEDSVRCEDCGGEIPPARLEAVKNATRCLPCQEAYERTLSTHQH